MALIVSVSGVRGIVGPELTPEIALRYAAAFASVLGGGPVAVGRDSRPSGRAFHHAVCAGLMGMGVSILDLGVVPTPTCGMLVRERGCRGGMQITASHNPAPYNGLKLFSGDGSVLSAAAGRQVQQQFESTPTQWMGWDNPATMTDATTAWRRHAERVLELVEPDRVRRAGYRVVLDANGGAGGPLGTLLLEALGCTVTPVGCEADGRFRHEPEPLPAHLGEIEAVVRGHSGSIGAVLDPDADRLVLIDESGTCLSEEATLALAIQERLRHDRGPVVINLSTSCMTEEVAREAGVACHRSPVGEANVVAKMRAVGALVGGEGNGGVIDPRVGWVRDPFIGLGLILGQMASTGRSLHDLAARLPKFVIRKEKAALRREQLPAAMAAFTATWPEARADYQDGLRLDWEDRWIQIRQSNTEPIVRIIAEARTAEIAHNLCEKAIMLVQSLEPA